MYLLMADKFGRAHTIILHRKQHTAKIKLEMAQEIHYETIHYDKRRIEIGRKDNIYLIHVR